MTAAGTRPTVDGRSVPASGGHLLHLAVLCQGALAALALLTHPAFAVAVLPALLLIRRGARAARLARTDPKTGLLTIDAWHQIAGHQLARAVRRHRPVAILMIDIDRFKRINDDYGHLAGDAVLAEVADAIAASIRERDALARFGGDEFAVFLAGITGADVMVLAERIRTAIRRLHITLPGCHPERVISDLTASIGAACPAPAARCAVRPLLHDADQALYAAKDSGRDAVILASTGPPAS